MQNRNSLIGTVTLLISEALMLHLTGCVTTERAALREVDVAFTTASSAKDLESWLSFISEDASMLPPNAPTLSGKDAIRERWSELHSDPGFALKCQVSHAEVSRGGDLGYTIGSYVLTNHDAAGKAVTDHGKYVTIWKRRSGGTWKMIVDTWNSNQPTSP